MAKKEMGRERKTEHREPKRERKSVRSGQYTASIADAEMKNFTEQF